MKLVQFASKNCFVAGLHFLSFLVYAVSMQFNSEIQLHRERRTTNDTSANQSTNRFKTFVTGNVTDNTLRGRGTATGSGSSTGNGNNLPPCRLCFGHGVKPSVDPRCKFGCRGGGRPTGSGSGSTNLLPTTMVRKLAFANMNSNKLPGCYGKQNCPGPRNSKMIAPKMPPKTEKEAEEIGGNSLARVLWVGFAAFGGLCLAALVVVVYRKTVGKKQTRVGVVEISMDNSVNASENI